MTLLYQLLAVAACIWTVCEADAPRNGQTCEDGVSIIADDDNLCTYWQCVNGVPVQRPCALTSRMHTHYTVDSGPVCGVSKGSSALCLRCDIPEDIVTTTVFVDYCAQNPCLRADCECRNQLFGRWCHCPNDVETNVQDVIVADTGFCDSSPCLNGGSCQSLFDRFFCRCPAAFTGVRCETGACDSNPCQNGGTCDTNDAGFFCTCRICFIGSCCEEELVGPNCRPPAPPVTCGPCQTREGNGCRNLDEECSCNPCPVSAPVCRNGSPGGQRSCQACGSCERYSQQNRRCEVREEDCGCNLCPSGQECSNGFGTNPRVCRACSNCDRFNFDSGRCELRVEDCNCNRCPGDQQCFNGQRPGEARTCAGCTDCERFNAGRGECVRRNDRCDCNSCPPDLECRDGFNFDTRTCQECGACQFFDRRSQRCVEDRHSCACNECPGNQDCTPGPIGEVRICSCPGCFSFDPQTQRCEPDDNRCGANEVCSPTEGCECGYCNIYDSFGRSCVKNTGACECTPCQDGEICEPSADPYGTPECISSPTAGRKFTMMFLENLNKGRAATRPPLEVYMASAGNYQSSVQVDAPRDECWGGDSYTASGTDLTRVQVPNDCMARIPGHGFKAITVTEDHGLNLVAYGVNKETFSADAFLALPDQIAGYFYRVVNWWPLSETSIGTEFGIVALSDNTRVTIKLAPGAARPSDETSDEFTITLNNLETYLVQDERASQSTDYTGTVIASDKPIHVYSGNIRAGVGEDETGKALASRDHMIEQIPSMEKWGKMFVIMPLGRSVDQPYNIFERIRIVRGEANIRIRCDVIYEENLRQTLFIEPEQYVIPDTFSSTDYSISISCSHPVMIAHFTQSQTEPIEDNHDPSMSYVVPYEQSAQGYIFSTPLYTGGASSTGPRPYDLNEIFIVAERSVRDGIYYTQNNGARVFPPELDWHMVPGDMNLWALRTEVEHGVVTVKHNNKGSFIASIYGYADRESYFTPMGMNKLELFPEVSRELLGLS